MPSRFVKRVVFSPGKVQSYPDNYFGCLARPVYTCRHLESGLSIGMHLLMGSVATHPVPARRALGAARLFAAGRGSEGGSQ